MASILVIEDNEALRVDVAKALRDGGHDVYEAEDGQAGFDLAVEKGSVDVVLTDHHMPRKTGLEMVSDLRAQEAYSETIVIFYTTESKGELRQQGKELGIKGWLIKPAPSHLILKTIDKALEKRAKAKAA
tara:strand:- start:318 stop:707 length:390 start_codon:yes stop_codon:yes gene_type:complete